ncbi:serine/threonine-protein kinase [Agreia sp. COWG]|uniref:serine/threonine-protein kinase n=1 Tax=Agreia sp. COWG TaxID=2773266 RepID=UPI001F01DD5C|nr:serine/threonine-protein kinase [Agreia sp. COWG]
MSPHPGELLDGRYRLDEQIGVGGMGVVYRAHDEALGRTVAVKVFRDSTADDSRTSSETRLLAGVNHSSLVTLYDAHLSPTERSYLVMEYVDGPTLREQISAAPLSAGEVAVMARDLAEALHVVHQAGIVHRDIKPSNILLRRSHVPGEHFRAKLADFGIAYLIDSTRLTVAGALVGTAAYLSPEQVKGAEPAPASDIYALGLVLLESLTGERAYPQSGTHEAALARLSIDPVIPSTLGYGWKSLLTAMTAKEPQQRPSAMDVVIAAGKIDVVEPDATASAISTSAPTEAMLATPTPTMVMPVEQLDEPTGATARTDSTAATVRMAATDPTVVDMPAQRTQARPAAPTEVLSKTRPSSPQKRPRPPRWLIVLVVVLVLIAAVVIVLIAVAGSSGPAAPSLPALDEPLNSHMKQLLDSVTR